MKMKDLLVKLRDVRSNYVTQSLMLAKELDVEMNEKLYDNITVYGLKGEERYEDQDCLVGMPMLNVIEALTRKTRVNDVTKPMREDFEALQSLLSKMEVKIRIGLDDRREAKKNLKEKEAVRMASAVSELNKLVDFNSLRVVSFKVGKLTKEEELKLVDVMESEDFVLFEQHEGYHYRFFGKVADKGSLKSQSHVVFSKIEGKVTSDRNFISNISTKEVSAESFLIREKYHQL